jgi:presenilin-like A22 family membrane protease
MENKEKIIENPQNIFLFEIVFFILVQIFGIFSAFVILKILNVDKISIEPVSFFDFIIGFAFATIFILLVIRFLKFKTGRNILFRAFFILAISFGSFLFFSLWIDNLFALILLTFLILLWILRPNVLVHNFLLFSGMVGIGSVSGLRLEPLMVILLLILLSIYDFIAVYKTKHMIKIAKGMIESGAILGLILPSTISGFKASLKEISPGGRFLILGGGDIIFPLILCVSLIPQGISSSLIVAFFATLGLALSFYLFVSQKIRKPIPALPPIAFFSIIGFLLTRLIL